jgi:hypothetical protein
MPMCPQTYEKDVSERLARLEQQFGDLHARSEQLAVQRAMPSRDATLASSTGFRRSQAR